MRTILVALAVAVLAGCAGAPTVPPQDTAALENIALSLVCAQTGVCLTASPAGAAGTGCSAPAIPDALLVPCPPPDPTQTPDQNMAAQLKCSTINYALLTLIAYQKSICSPTTITTPTATTTAGARRTYLIMPR